MEILDLPIESLKEINLYDIPIIHHGFEYYNRDYYFLVFLETKKKKGRCKLIFTHCFDFNYRHKFADKKFPELLRRSWDDELILPTLPSEASFQNSFWWGQGFTSSYPGFTFDQENMKVKEMIEITGKKMFALKLETEHYIIELIFHDFKYIFLE